MCALARIGIPVIHIKIKLLNEVLYTLLLFFQYKGLNLSNSGSDQMEFLGACRLIVRHSLLLHVLCFILFRPIVVLCKTILEIQREKPLGWQLHLVLILGRTYSMLRVEAYIMFQALYISSVITVICWIGQTRSPFR